MLCGPPEPTTTASTACATRGSRGLAAGRPRKVSGLMRCARPAPTAWPIVLDLPCLSQSPGPLRGMVRAEPRAVTKIFRSLHLEPPPAQPERFSANLVC